jgi:hypothetical protein
MPKLGWTIVESSGPYAVSAALFVDLIMSASDCRTELPLYQQLPHAMPADPLKHAASHEVSFSCAACQSESKARTVRSLSNNAYNCSPSTGRCWYDVRYWQIAGSSTAAVHHAGNLFKVQNEMSAKLTEVCQTRGLAAMNSCQTALAGLHKLQRFSC